MNAIIVLGLLQGLTEFLPISSSGHLFLANELFNLNSSFGIDIILNIGTLLAAVIYFSRDIKKILADLFLNKNNSLVRNILITTTPAIIIGGVVGLYFESYLRTPVIVVCMLAIVGVVMVLEDRLFKPQTKDLSKLSASQALKIGLTQVLAVIPGTSRSAVTILAGKSMGLNNSSAARYSFLVSIPVISAAIVFAMLFRRNELFGLSLGEISWGVGVAFVTALISIHFMMQFLKQYGLKYFGWYRLILVGVVLFIL